MAVWVNSHTAIKLDYYFFYNFKIKEYKEIRGCIMNNNECNNNLPKIVLKHTRIEINNYYPGDCPNLEYMFTLDDRVSRKQYIKAIELDAENHKLIVPRGLDISYLTNMFMCTPYIDYECDPYVNAEPTPIKYLTRDERQMEILKFILGKDKYAYTAKKSQLSINATTGLGKTFLAVGAICYTGARAIIITSSINWLQQWKEKILEYTPIKEEEMFFVQGSGSINKLAIRDVTQYRIFLISHSTITSFGNTNGWHKVDEFFASLKCSLKIYDEAHLYFDNMTRIDFHSNTKKTLYLTATPLKSDRAQDIIYQLYFKNVPSISLFDERKDPHVNYKAIHINTHPSAKVIQDCNSAYGFDRNKYTAFASKDPYFLNFVVILMDMLINISGKVLIYIGTNAAIDSILAHILDFYPFLGNYVGVYTSIIPKEQKEQALKKKFILSTTKSCGAASDIPDLMVTVNLAEPFRSPVLARQTLGRCRADNSLYIDVVDEGFYYTKSYYKSKKPIFNRYAKSFTDIYMDIDEIEERTDKLLDKYNNYDIMCMQVFTR